MQRRRRAGRRRSRRTRRVDDARRAAHALGLPARARVGQRARRRARSRSRRRAAAGRPPSHSRALVAQRVVRAAEAQADVAAPRRPDAELDEPAVDARGRARADARQGYVPAAHRLGHEPEPPSGGRVISAENGWPCHGDGLGLDAAQVADVRAAVVLGVGVEQPPASGPARQAEPVVLARDRRRFTTQTRTRSPSRDARGERDDVVVGVVGARASRSRPGRSRRSHSAGSSR